MIRYYGYWMFHTREVVTPLLQGLDDSEEFSVVDVIVSFGGGESGRVVSAWVKVSVGVLLHEYSPGGSKGSISHDEKWLGSVQHLDHRS